MLLTSRLNRLRCRGGVSNVHDRGAAATQDDVAVHQYNLMARVLFITGAAIGRMGIPLMEWSVKVSRRVTP